MKKILMARYAVYIPESKLDAVSKQTDAITREAGGFTLSTSAGGWLDSNDAMVCERIMVLVWWYDHGRKHWPRLGEYAARMVMPGLIDELCYALFELGEEAVSVEFQDDNTANRMEIRTNPELTGA